MLRAGKILPKRRSISSKETFNKGIKFTAQNYCLECGAPIQNNYKYCSNECQLKHQNKERLKDWQTNPENYCKEEIPNFIRNYLINKYQGCQLCG